MDFILPSCPGIPDSMWIAASSMIDIVLKKCWALFGVFLTIKFIADALIDIANGHFELGHHIRNIFQAILVGIFLAYYKFLLMFFDSFIDSLCAFDEAVMSSTLEKAKDRIPNHIENQSWFSSIKSFCKMLFDFFPKMIALLTHAGAIQFMHYLKALALLVMSQVGPLATLFSLLPGPFKKGWSTWAKSYIHTTCWTITLHIFWALSKAFATVSTLTQEVNTPGSFFEETVGYSLLSLVFFIAIFLTPTWTSKFIGSAITANIGAAISMAASRIRLGKGFSQSASKIK